MHYYLFTIQYDGTNFCGWAKQKNQLTIQGELEKAISRVAKNSFFHLVGASKTDAGVHALDQKVWVQLGFAPRTEGFIKVLNKCLSKSIVIKKIEKINKNFRVRNCKQKIYEYRINVANNNILNNRFYYFSQKPIDIKKLKKSLKVFEGEHNFLNYSGIKNQELKEINTIRKIDKIKIKKSKSCYIITFKAKGFIRYQIRMILGACLAYCWSKITLNKIINVLKLKENKLPYMANPEGLILKKIIY